MFILIISTFLHMHRLLGQRQIGASNHQTSGGMIMDGPRFLSEMNLGDLLNSCEAELVRAYVLQLYRDKFHWHTHSKKHDYVFGKWGFWNDLSHVIAKTFLKFRNVWEHGEK